MPTELFKTILAAVLLLTLPAPRAAALDAGDALALYLLVGSASIVLGIFGGATLVAAGLNYVVPAAGRGQITPRLE